jgi:hypothetical protein
MGEKDHPKRKSIAEVKPVRFVVRVGSPTRIVRFLELALSAAAYPKALLPRGNHMVFTWKTFGAGQVCRPARPDRGQYPCQEQTPQ